MKTSIIEQADKTRYNLLKWLTLGWALGFGVAILKELVYNNILIGIMLLAGLSGWVLWCINQFRLIKLMKVINADPSLRLAMNDELHQYNSNKAVKIGFLAVMVTAGMFLVVSVFFNISSLIVSEAVIYVGVLSVLIASLIYNKDYGKPGIKE